LRWLLTGPFEPFAWLRRWVRRWVRFLVARLVVFFLGITLLPWEK
jgi:hypothetical protein